MQILISKINLHMHVFNSNNSEEKSFAFILQRTPSGTGFSYRLVGFSLAILFRSPLTAPFTLFSKHKPRFQVLQCNSRFFPGSLLRYWKHLCRLVSVTSQSFSAAMESDMQLQSLGTIQYLINIALLVQLSISPVQGIYKDNHLH